MSRQSANDPHAIVQSIRQAARNEPLPRTSEDTWYAIMREARQTPLGKDTEAFFKNIRD
jgi:hypothetical protein